MFPTCIMKISQSISLHNGKWSLKDGHSASLPAHLHSSPKTKLKSFRMHGRWALLSSIIYVSDLEWQLWDDAHFQDMLDTNVHDLNGVEEDMDDNIVVDNRILVTDNNTTSFM